MPTVSVVGIGRPVVPSAFTAVRSSPRRRWEARELAVAEEGTASSRTQRPSGGAASANTSVDTCVLASPGRGGLPMACHQHATARSRLPTERDGSRSLPGALSRRAPTRRAGWRLEYEERKMINLDSIHTV